jgi:hypothetical protein
MTEDLKESIKRQIKDEVKKIVSDTVQKLVKASAKKTVTALRDRLKEEATRQLEKELKQTVKELEKEFSKDVPQDSEYLQNIKKVLDKSLGKCLSIAKGTPPLLVAAISCACLLLIWAGIYCCWIGPKPLPKPDLLITQVEAEWTDEGVVISYTVANQGEGEAGASCSYLYIGESFLTIDYVEPLAPGAEMEGAFPASPLSEEDVYVSMKLCADGSYRIDESNEDNNCATMAGILVSD